MDNFLYNLPKVELHAHLNGSLKLSSIRELSEMLFGSNTPEFLQLSQQFIHFKDERPLDECFKKFRFMHELTASKKGLKLATTFVIRDFAEDNIMHLELRTTPKENAEFSKRAYLECVIDAIENAKETYNSICVKLLPSIDRSQTLADAENTLAVVLELQALYPDIIRGIDLSGNPSVGCFRDFAPLLERARQSGLPLVMHCAEIDNPAEVSEMLDFGMSRCGHGTFLNSTQLVFLGQQGVAVECCLSSNVKCGTVENFSDHHFQRIFSQSAAAVVLCTDDSGVFDTTLTKELIIAAKTFCLQHKDFYRLMLNAITHSFALPHEKLAMQIRLTTYFESNNCNIDI